MSPSASPTLHLHLGVHKTGSTFLQKTFLHNSDQLGSADLAYLPLAEMRRDVTSRLLRASRHDFCREGSHLSACREVLAAAMDGRRSVLLSDENLLGSLYTFSKRLGAYPRAERHVGLIAKLLDPGMKLVIYMGLRDYSQWLESAYLQVLKRRRLLSFESFIATVSLGSISWLSLVGRISARLPGAAIVLWRYEDFAQDNHWLLNHLSLRLGLASLTPATCRSNPSLSAIGHQVLMACRDNGIREQDVPRVLKFVRKRLSSAQGYGKPVFFPGPVSAALRARYGRDLEDCARMPRVVFLDPPAPSP